MTIDIVKLRTLLAADEVELGRVEFANLKRIRARVTTLSLAANLPPNVWSELCLLDADLAMEIAGLATAVSQRCRDLSTLAKMAKEIADLATAVNARYRDLLTLAETALAYTDGPHHIVDCTCSGESHDHTSDCPQAVAERAFYAAVDAVRGGA